jgi:flagellar protein FlgJ
MTPVGYRIFTDLRHHPGNYIQLEIHKMNPITLPRSGMPPLSPGDQALRAAAQKLEASFISEMLKSAGLGAASKEFGGGEGEDQFASFLVDEHAMQMVRSGGIGLAESLFQSLKERSNDE